MAATAPDIDLSRFLLPVLALASAGALSAAYIAEFGFGLEPCTLCRYQRAPYWLVLVLASGGLAGPARLRPLIAILSGAVLLAGAGIAVYHFGVEQHWWQAATACGAGEPLPLNFEAFRAAPLKPLAKSCGEADWTMFGVSITFYNAVFGATWAAIGISGGLRMRNI